MTLPDAIDSPAPSFAPKERADTATRQLLRAQFASLKATEPGVKAALDPEALHDFRVAVRRTRSALGQIKAVFPAHTTRRYADAFAELGRITSEPRDLDVALLDFEQLQAELPENLRADLDPLRELLQTRAAAAHARLNAYLDSRTYRDLARTWEKFLNLPPPRRTLATNAPLPIRSLADQRLHKLYRRILREGAAITPDSPPEQLHALRKTAKKLRYLLEFFRALYPADKLDRLVKSLKRLQEYLGDYQDVHTQIEQLRGFAEDLRETGAPTASLLALGALLDRRYGRERALRAGFAAEFAAFAKDSRKRSVRRLFKPGKDRAGG